MNSDDIKYIDVKDFREQGYLSELNRRFLHPLGLALSVSIKDDGSVGLDGIWDHRDDPEGIIFGADLAEIVAANARAINTLWEERSRPRIDALGYMVQPSEGTE